MGCNRRRVSSIPAAPAALSPRLPAARALDGMAEVWRGRGDRMRRQGLLDMFVTSNDICSVAQRKRVGLITQRSEDRNLVEQYIKRHCGRVV